ncbi:MAG: gluconolaconase [Rhodopirellula sp.]|nr:gluconolaconase [Rhodopirellula sp.]
MHSRRLFLTICIPLVLTAMTQADDITENQQKLLKTFRGEFVKITPGKGKFPKSFEMGSDSATQSPVHKVTFDYSFSVAKYEVPQNLWEAVMGSNPSRWKGPRNSVEELSFADAESFCKKATQMMQQLNLIEKNESIRLPSESEWEYFARAGTTTAYSFGDDVKQLTDYGWFTGNAAGNDPPVGVKKPNAWGLYDIHGYLWEWCTDTGSESYKNAPIDGSPRIDSKSKMRILRGGSWKDAADKLTSSYRSIVPADLKDDAVGLRCILVTK